LWRRHVMFAKPRFQNRAEFDMRRHAHHGLRQ
jgi:hypothetical protein